MSVYNPKDIEKKWQDFWDEHDTYVTKMTMIKNHSMHW